VYINGKETYLDQNAFRVLFVKSTLCEVQLQTIDMFNGVEKVCTVVADLQLTFVLCGMVVSSTYVLVMKLSGENIGNCGRTSL
jgi:hypothetical protein